MLTLVQFKAQPGADGKPAKDANGRFIKGDLVAYTVMEKRSGWGTEYPDDIRNGEWEYQVFGPTRRSTPKPTLPPASNATSRMPVRISSSRSQA